MVSDSEDFGLRDSIVKVHDNIREDKKSRWNRTKETFLAINRSMPEAIKRIIEGHSLGDYTVKGQSGNSGNWNTIVCVAILDPQVCNLNNKVTMKSGVYPVYLFSEFADRLYLSLGQSTSEKKLSELTSNAKTVRSVLEIDDYRTDIDSISLEDNRNYAQASIVFKEYDTNNLPSSKVLVSDLLKMMSFYKIYKEKVWSAEPSGGEPAPPSSGGDTGSTESYSPEDFIEETSIKEGILNEILSILKIKRNIILQGPPGVGKTFIAKRLAYVMQNSKTDDHIKTVQFHQSYGYEEFIYGLRPIAGGGFKFEPGIFFKLCKTASQDPNPDSMYFLIIDEINRANISRVFGEVLMLIESGHRGESVDIMYNGESLEVPKNLYIIGTMNTADRSIAMMDYALRRRFAFIPMAPDFDIAMRKGKLSKALKDELVALNKEISDDTLLGEGFMIGHSYFIDNPNQSYVVKYEIAPLLREYWYDDKDKAEKKIVLLTDAAKSE